MSTPVVVRVVLSPAREPLSDYVRRAVELSDGTHRMEAWDYTRGAWIECHYDTWGYAHCPVLSDEGLRRLGIPVDPVFDGAAPGGC